jgi:predicted amidophosphoribosyltransferase
MAKAKPVLSRQRAWQLQRIADKLCYLCGQPLEHYRMRCDRCALKARERAREKTQCEPWYPGGPGRAPKVQ